MWIAPQARDLFFETIGSKDGDGHLSWFADPLYNNIIYSLIFAFVFCISVIGFWAIPLHGAARWSLDGLADPPQTMLGKKTKRLIKPRPPLSRNVSEWTPRILGLTVFVAVCIGIAQSTSAELNEKLVSTAQSARYQLYILAGSAIIGAILFYLYTRTRYKIFNQLIGRPTGHAVTVERGENARVIKGRGIAFLQVLAGIYVAFITVILILFIFRREPFVPHLDLRALLLPIVLGGWVPLLSFLTWLSYPARVPVLTILIALVIFLQHFYEGHQVRALLHTNTTSNEMRQLDFYQAVRLWQKANNNCTDDCPQPIIVAAAGGASRAAYFVASTLGFFMDSTCDPAGQPVKDGKLILLPCNTVGTPAFANHLFAISGTSGGALGPAVFSAMLRAYQEAGSPAGPPCRKESSAFWFHSGQANGWRDCMQEILSEDFLSPAIFGLVFRDVFPFFGLFEDRAALLEDSWISAFSKFVPNKSGEKGADAASGLMDASFESFAPKEGGPWRPLLVFNGTSVATGNRILTSHFSLRSHGRLLFTGAYDFREMFNVEAAGADARTISLATAVTNSARFPVISPEGVILKDQKHVLDRIVDGGYFENYGITTAQDIAKALIDCPKEVGADCPHNLKPLILIITNDPLSAKDVERLARGQLSPPMPEDQDGLWIPWLSSPLLALYQTRSSRGDLAATRTAQYPIEFGGDVLHVTVYQEPNSAVRGQKGECKDYTSKSISMSWWLSKPVQEYLDNQFFDVSYSCGKQQERLHKICNSFGGELSNRCGDFLHSFLTAPTSQ